MHTLSTCQRICQCMKHIRNACYRVKVNIKCLKANHLNIKVFLAVVLQTLRASCYWLHSHLKQLKWLCALSLWSSLTVLWVRPPEERERLNSSGCNTSGSRIRFMSNHWRGAWGRARVWGWKWDCCRREGAEQSWGVCVDLLRSVCGSPAGRQPWVVLTESLFVVESAAALGSTRTERRGQ